MRTKYFLVLILFFVLPSLLAEEALYSFSCKELYQLGTQSVPTFSSRWFWAGLCITFASTFLGAYSSWEVSDEYEIGLVAGAAIGMSFSIFLPLVMNSSPSYVAYENAEDKECFTDGYRHMAKARNSASSLLGSLVGAAVPVILAIVLDNILSNAFYVGIPFPW